MVWLRSVPWQAHRLAQLPLLRRRRRRYRLATEEGADRFQLGQHIDWYQQRIAAEAGSA